MKRNFISLAIFISLFSLGLFLPTLSADSGLLSSEASPEISMDFQNASLKDILKVFSIQSGLNFIASEALQDRKITLYLDKVPLKKAMDKLFNANNLSYELDSDANIFIVKDWGKLQTETVTRVFYLKYATVSTSSLEKEKASSLAATGSTISSGPLGSATTTGSTRTSSGSTSTEGGGITKAVKNLLSSAGSVIEDFRTNSLIITDTPNHMQVIAQVIASLDIPVPQVMLEVEMLDVSKDTVDKIGFDFGDNPLTLIVHRNQGVKTFLGTMAYRSATIPGGAGAIVFGHTYAGLLDYLRTRTDTKYLARPRLLTLNNETAEISLTKDEVVGKTETPGTQTSAPTVNYIRSTDLKLTPEGVGIFLRVTPQINPETNEITMVINPKSSVTSASALSTTDNPQSDIEIRSTKSIVKVHDGETIVLGGLLHREKIVTTKKLPILGDIPIVGALFRHKDVSKDLERELLVFITPHIIKDTGIKLAKTKKAIAFEREQDVASGVNRESRIKASLNSFEKTR